MKGKRLLRHATTQIIDTIFPPRCLACPELTETPMGLCGTCWREVHFLGGSVCDLCGIAVPTDDGTTGRTICNGCDRSPPPWDRGRAAVAYEGVGRRIVMSFKHSDRLDMAKPLARWMTGAGADLIKPEMLVVPVPLHWSKLLRRRYNQAAVLATHVAERAGLEVIPDLILRTRATPELKDMTVSERMSALHGALAINPAQGEKAARRDILLIDDVMTSGATLTAATHLLGTAKAGSVSVLTLARVARAE